MLTRKLGFETLRVPELQIVAQATGIRESRPKDAIIRRFENEFSRTKNNLKLEFESQYPRSSFRPTSGDADKKEEEIRKVLSLPRNNVRKDGAVSILSIDMGIRNLGIAHFLVPRAEPSSASQSGTKYDKNVKAIDDNIPELGATPILNAWQRLNVSKLPLTPEEDAEDVAETASKRHNTPEDDVGIELRPIKGKQGGLPAFSIPLYASHAYTLITSLLDTYRPTHILIERQRFRSNGSHEVLEWALRVGLFESMLYTVLHTLREQMSLERSLNGPVGEQQRKGRGDGKAQLPPPPFVEGVDPRRVYKYWKEEAEVHEEQDPISARPNTRKRQRIERAIAKGSAPNDVIKKAKINIVGHWLLDWRERETGADKEGESSETTSDSQRRTPNRASAKLHVAQDPKLRDLVDAYLRKWLKSLNIKKDDPLLRDAPKGVKLEKLDDLADCLIQGITWVDWQAMRCRILREGLGAVFPEKSS